MNSRGGLKKPEKTSLKKKLVKSFLVIFTILFVILGGIFGYIYFEARSVIGAFSEGEKEQIVIDTKKELGQDPLNKFPGLKKVKTYLLLGYDVRTAIKPDDPGRTDTILMVRVYPKQKMASILSLPRDLYVPIPGYGEDRINAAYTYGGVPLLVKTIRDWTGVKIDHFVQVGFTSFIDLVNDLDGVYLPVDQRYLNDGSNGYMAIDLLPGYQRLKGEDALTFVRFRSGDSDFYRASRQQIFIRETGRALRAKNTSINDYKSLIEIVSKHTTSDLQSLPELLGIANTLRSIPAENIARTSMSGSPATMRGMSVIIPSEEEKNEAIKTWDNPGKLIKGQEKALPLKLSALEKANLLQFVEIAMAGTNNSLSNKANKIKKDLVKKALDKKLRKTSKDAVTKEVSLIDSVSPVSSSKIKHCTPTKLPSGYYWPSESVHEYILNKKPALASYATAGSGRSVLFMWSGWQNPIILNKPSDLLKIPGDKRVYRLYWESGRVRMIAWKDGKTVSWITNTLQNELDKETMIGLALGCDR